MNLWGKIRAKQHGFTTIELVFVIVIIGILVGIIVIGHAGIAQQTRNTERQRDIGELHAELEAYYSQYNKYPTLAELNNTTWRSTYMKGVNTQVFRDPSGSSYQLVTLPAKNVYAYNPTTATGKTCNDTTTTCVQYILTATLQGGGTYVTNNLN